MPQRSCCLLFSIFSLGPFFFFFLKSAFFGWSFPWCVKVNFYTVHNENGTLALPLTPSLCLPPFAMGGNDKLELWKGKKIKGFIVQ